ncbi:MAG: hypothetical protein HRU70_04535 [Phycisphaeraceae bacterium]|nr:MAG: hypothetical protein HRU70_04535 [Phycisphaeraceae bacterium]
MNCALCSKLLVPVIALAAAGAAGVGGYNWYTTGCPLGSCSDGDAAAGMIAASSKKAKKSSCCPGDAHAHHAKEAPKDAAGCGAEACAEAGECSQACKTACEDKAAGECADKASHSGCDHADGQH